MPTYQYACTECDHAFEQFQSFSEDSLTDCPECEGRVRKVFNAVGVVFKGSGFYKTDSRASTKDSGSGGSGDNGSGPSDSSGKGSSDSSEKSSSGSGEPGSSSGGTSTGSSGSSSGSSTSSRAAAS